MEDFDLFTKGGTYVTTATLPLFNPRAESIIWGTRVFLWSEAHGKYIECSAFYCYQSHDKSGRKSDSDFYPR